MSRNVNFAHKIGLMATLYRVFRVAELNGLQK